MLQPSISALLSFGLALKVKPDLIVFCKNEEKASEVSLSRKDAMTE
jgi:hypothetical protein